MSEKVSLGSPEQRIESVDAVSERPAEKAQYSAEDKAKNVEQAEAAVNQVEAGITEAERPALPIDDQPADNQWIMIDKVAKTFRRKQNMKHIQNKLPVAERALSKFAHQPAVSAVSEVSSKTVTRPSGLLGGGLMAFVGSLAYLLLANHVGFTYNYLLFVIFFVGGFVVGLIFELLAHTIRRRHA